MIKLFKCAIRIAVWIPAVLMAIVIFGFSSQDGVESGGLSYKVADVLISGVEKLGLADVCDDDREVMIEKLQYPIRKCAHISEFAVFTILVVIAFYVNKLHGTKLYMISWLSGVLFAATDEFHQLYVPGRCGSFVDVCIDSTGCLIGVFVAFMASYIYKCLDLKRRNKLEENCHDNI